MKEDANRKKNKMIAQVCFSEIQDVIDKWETASSYLVKPFWDGKIQVDDDVFHRDDFDEWE
jgi:hypothetical protein